MHLRKFRRERQVQFVDYRSASSILDADPHLRLLLRFRMCRRRPPQSLETPRRAAVNEPTDSALSMTTPQLFEHPLRPFRGPTLRYQPPDGSDRIRVRLSPPIQMSCHIRIQSTAYPVD